MSFHYHLIFISIINIQAIIKRNKQYKKKNTLNYNIEFEKNCKLLFQKSEIFKNNILQTRNTNFPKLSYHFSSRRIQKDKENTYILLKLIFR